MPAKPRSNLLRDLRTLAAENQAASRNRPAYQGYLSALVARGGPTPEEYSALDRWISSLFLALDRGEISQDVIESVRREMSPVLAAPTMHGFACSKPHGYAGDFEIIDRHYLTYIVPDPHFEKWDRYWHSCPAARAVRNRKDYFHHLLRRHFRSAPGLRLRVLNLASGPCRDVLEFLSSSPCDVHFDCVEQDAKAITHAANLCADFSGRLTFHCANALRFRPSQSYDLIWAAGLFDYFSDRVFKRVLHRLLPFIAPHGEVVIGNYGITKPHSNLSWLRFCDWNLHHRSAEDLTALARESGVSDARIHLGREAEGVTLFLHISSSRS